MIDNTDTDFHTWATAQGVTSYHDLPEAAQVALQESWRRSLTPHHTRPGTVNPAADEIRELVAAAVLDDPAHADAYQTILDAAMTSTTTPTQARLAILRASRGTAGGVYVAGRSGPATGADAIAAALMVRSGFGAAAERAFGPGVMNGLGRLQKASLVDLAAAALRFDGRDVPGSSQGVLSASVSTGSFPVGLSNAAGRIAEAAYAAERPTWAGFAAVRSAANFKEHTGVRPSFFGDLTPLAPGGNVGHGSFGEETYTWSVSTYARLLTLDRTHLVNDDLNLFAEIIPSSVKAAGRTLSSLVWAAIMANGGSFFSSGHANLGTTGASALGTTGLAAALQRLRKQVDAEGNSLNMRPAVLAAPPELELTARQLLADSQLNRTGDQSPTGNPYADLCMLEVEPRLSNSSYTGYSTTAWYLFAAPSDAPVLVGYLEGQRTPKTEFFGFDSDPNKLAASWRIYHDFGCALGDYRAADKSEGA